MEKVDVDKELARINSNNFYQQIRADNYGLIVLDDMSHHMMRPPFDSDDIKKGVDEIAKKHKVDVVVNRKNDFVQRAVNVVIVSKNEKLPAPKIRKAHNIYDDQWDRVWRGIKAVLGSDWDKIAFRELKKVGVRDYFLTENYSCTLFDQDTILVFDTTKLIPKKKVDVVPEVESQEPLWDEKDLVISQSGWS